MLLLLLSAPRVFFMLLSPGLLMLLLHLVLLPLPVLLLLLLVVVMLLLLIVLYIMQGLFQQLLTPLQGSNQVFGSILDPATAAAAAATSCPHDLLLVAEPLTAH
jgi:hypothetical protein